MPEKDEKVTEEQANQALQQLLSETPGMEEAAAAEPAAEEPAQEEPPAQESAEQPEEPVAAAPEAAADDLKSLESRYETRLKETESRYEARLKALQARQQENDRILRDKYVRKSAVVDKALKTLRATRTPEGIAEGEVDSVIRELEGTMNPASTSYSPPPTGYEDQAIVVNEFLNEKGMTTEEADEFGRWVRADAPAVLSPTEQAIAQRDLDGFLRVAHYRWQEGMREKDKKAKVDDAVQAVKSVQRTQREAARAAAPTAAPKKQPPPQNTAIDVKKLTKEDISALLRQSVEQYQ